MSSYEEDYYCLREEPSAYLPEKMSEKYGLS